MDEEATYADITHTRLGVDIDPLQVDKTPKHTASAKPNTSGNKSGCEQDCMNFNDVKICINKLMMDDLSQQIIVTCKLLEDLPKSR